MSNSGAPSCPNLTNNKAYPIIAIASGKGGVGKSTVTHNLAAAMVMQGLKVGIIDADIYGPSQTNLFGAFEELSLISQNGRIIPVTKNGIAFVSVSTLLAGDSPIIWRAPMAVRLISDLLHRVQWPELDCLLIDLPPGTGDIQITLAQQAKLSAAIIVTTPHSIAYKIAEKSIQMFNKVKVPVMGIVENMAGFNCANCNTVTHIFGHNGANKIAKANNIPLLTSIPLDQELINLAEESRSIITAKDDNTAKAAYLKLAEKINILIPELINNEPETIEVIDNQLIIKWPNASEYKMDAYTLRINCPCANCVDETTGQELIDKNSIDSNIGIIKSEQVGRYGLKITFTDRHDTGIFLFDSIKSMPKVTLKKEHKNIEKQTTTTEILDKERMQEIIDRVLNPQVANHGGFIKLEDIKDQQVFIRMQGGCQGCSQSQLTLKEGVSKVLKQHFPSITDIIDITNHEKGKNPYYS